MNSTYHRFFPPKNATITRVLTFQERRATARKDHAKYVSCVLQTLHRNYNLKPLHVSEFGNRLTFSFYEKYANVHVNSRSWGRDVHLPYVDDHRDTLSGYLSKLQPTTVARLLKLANKSLQDRTAREGDARKQQQIAKNLIQFQDFSV
jgi:hypothetical protein